MLFLKNLYQALSLAIGCTKSGILILEREEAIEQLVQCAFIDAFESIDEYNWSLDYDYDDCNS